MGDRPRATNCRNSARHWFSEYGAPGFRLPRCVRCGAPNVRWSAADQADYEGRLSPAERAEFEKKSDERMARNG